MSFGTLEGLCATAFGTLQPTELLGVSEAAKRYHFIKQPGSHVGFWSPEKTPYLLEPQEVLTSLDYTGMVFVGPARTGKSNMLLNWLSQGIKCDPADMMVVHMAQHTGREWSKSDLEKMFRNSEELRKELRPGRQNDNTFDKEFLSGMRLTVTWPTANNLSGKTVPRLWLMDYDRMPDDVDGEGNPYDLTKKRATTFRRFGMCVAESSPNPDKESKDPKWIPKRPHQAPPIRGIFEIYNRGDMRRWYWACPHCGEAFEPSFKTLSWEKSIDLVEAAHTTVMVCPNHGCVIEPRFKEELNVAGRWVKSGQVWIPSENRIQNLGEWRPVRSDIASFWMKGPAAYWQDWSSLVLEFLRAEQAYEDTGDETPLKKTVTTDQGEFYIAKSRQSERNPEDMKQKAEDWGATELERTVPFGTRFLIVTVDVQGRAFVYQTHAFTEDDVIIIDSDRIRKSNRLDAEGDRLPIDPAAFKEDWDQMIEHVMTLSYPLADGSGRRMSVRMAGCDSGGSEGVTHQAYEAWRRLKSDPRGWHRRFALLKGEGSKSRPRVVITWPDSKQTGLKAVARGDVPVLLLNSNPLKDMVAAMIQRRLIDTEEQGGGMLRYPTWLPDWFYVQMTNEVRIDTGWDNPAKRRNETWDLTYYAIAMALKPRDDTCPLGTIAWHKIDWSNPPTWAEEWDRNDYVSADEAGPTFAPQVKKKSFAELGQTLS